MHYFIIILCAYIVGCSSMSYYLGKFNNVDMKQKGSKNLGASNTVILMGWKAGIAVGIHDVGKAMLAVLIARYFFPNLEYAGEVAGVACVLGHIYPFYLNFDGGKGFASYVGMTLALNWKLGLVLILIIIAITLITDYIVCGTMTTMILVPIYQGYINHNVILAGILCIASIVIIYKHRDNLVRIWNGTEFKFRNAGRKKVS